jgi:peptide/nickel transport system substrate-binding protein
VEYDSYLPDSFELRCNHVSNGPYRVIDYAETAPGLRMERNTAWRQESDPIRHQYLDGIEIAVEALPADVLRGRIDAGEVDLAWSYTVVSWGQPTPDLDGFPRSYPGFALNPYLVFNLRSPNEGGALANQKVRQAIAFGIDRIAISEILDVLEGVPNAPLHSTIPEGNVGHRDFNPYPTPGDRGNPERSRALLAEAGYERLTLVAAVREAGLHQNVMRSVKDDLAECGIELTFRTYNQADYYGTLLSDPEKARAGEWDIAEPGWTPDWFGNNGRAVIQPLFQTNDAPGTTNYGGYSNPEVDQLIERALEEPDPARADELWHELDRRVMADLPIIPLLSFAAMTSRYHSRRVKNAIHVPQIEFFDITNLWLDQAA